MMNPTARETLGSGLAYETISSSVVKSHGGIPDIALVIELGFPALGKQLADIFDHSNTSIR